MLDGLIQLVFLHIGLSLQQKGVPVLQLLLLPLIIIAHPPDGPLQSHLGQVVLFHTHLLLLLFLELDPPLFVLTQQFSYWPLRLDDLRLR